MEDPRRGAQGTRPEEPGRRHEQPRKRRSVPGGLSGDGRAAGGGAARSGVSLQDLELSPCGAPRPEGGGGGGEGAQMGGKEAVGAGRGTPGSCRGRAPLSARLPRARWVRAVPSSRGEIRAEPTRAGDAGARLRGGDGPLGGAWVSVLSRGTGAERLRSDPKRRRGAAQRRRSSAATRRWCAPIWSRCGFGARAAPRARELS